MAESIWKQLNRDFSLSGVAQAFRSVASDSSSPSTRNLVDTVLETARVEALQRGVSLEAVLRERGFELPVEVIQQAELRLSQSLPAVGADEPESTGASVSQPPTRNGEEVKMEKWLTSVAQGPWGEAEQARATAWVQSSEAVRQSFVVGLLPEAEHNALLSRRPGPDLAAALLKASSDADALHGLLACLPGSVPAARQQALVDAWLEQEIVSYKALREARDQAIRTAVPVIAQLVQANPTLTDTVWPAVARFFGMEMASAPAKPVAATPELLPWVRAFAMAPVRKTKNEMVIAVSFLPPDWWTAKLEATLDKFKVQLVFAAPADIEQWRSGWMTEQAVPSEASSGQPAPKKAEVPSEMNLRMQRAAASRNTPAFVQELFNVAVLSRATDVHVEPIESAYRIRLRVDGVCTELVRMTSELSNEFFARIKVLAEMDVTERRRPQDGSLRMTGDGRQLDLRLSTLPTRRGEKLAIRIADGQSVGLNLAELGLSEEEVQKVRDVARRPHGLLLTTGPVGSGKTTTLYSCLNELDRTRLHIASIEDPVEIELEGTNQVEVNRLTGVDFPTGLRALLRQDPDVMLIGEIRDLETAQIGVRAAMTGRMVYSTLHANSAAEAVTTLRNFGIQNFIIASTLQGAIAQRLMRRVCPHCSVAVKLSRQDLDSMGLKQAPRTANAKRGTGCPQCGNTGYRGRIGVYELLTIDPTIRNLIEQGARASEIEAAARASGGFKSLHQSAVDLILNGMTTPEERHRVLGPPPVQPQQAATAP